MNFERIALSQYLVNNLKPLTAADPNILADYVVALLKNDLPSGELQKLCADRLEVFLGHSSMSFTTKLFEALQEGAFRSTKLNMDAMKSPEQSMSNAAAETLEDNQPSSSEPLSDPEDKENSDDDDRNHKHRKRDARENSLDNAVQEQPIRRFSRKRNQNYDNDQLYMETGVQSHEIQKEYSLSTERDVPSRLEKRHFGIPPSVRSSSELNLRSRLNSSFRTDLGPRPDLFTSVCRTSHGRGRGRNLAPWSQPDSRFNSLDSLDFTSHMASQRPVHPGLFVGPGLQSAGSSQNASWGAFGFIHGLSNGIMDPLHPIGLPRSNMNPMNLGMPRQRCRDFEERGFCLRGDMCPMEHGVNRIVVEDVQSLSQFNLPGSIPSSLAVGAQAATGPLHPAPASSVLMANKSMFSKNSKATSNENTLRLNGPNSTVGGEADVYDPDQPLWNNNTDSSVALLKLPSPNTEDESLWDGDTSRKISQLSDGSECDLPSRSLTDNTGPLVAGSSVWGRIGSGSKSEIDIKFENNNSASGHLAKEIREVKEANVCSSLPLDQSKLISSEEFGSKMVTTELVSAPRTDFDHKGGRMKQKANRTLFVCAIPQKNNRKEALLSHFRKFGEVIDIYIPLNSETAFVQFSKREMAEAALNSPDAVMGNRFIKLFWAKRDRISDEGQGSGGAKPLQYPSTVANAAQMRPPAVEIGKRNLSSAVQRESNTKAVEAAVPSVGPQKGVILNGPKSLTSPKKKLESLELLEELRRKQELLDQKRDEFRRQLVKFERQTSIKKSDGLLELAVKRQKIDPRSVSTKTVDSESTTASISEECRNAGKSIERSSLAEVQVSPSSKSSLVPLQQSAQIVKQATPTRTPTSYSNRFKLDNRSTSFRILPPLPAKLGNVAILKDHFSKFGDLASIVFEGTEKNENLKQPDKRYVCVTFHTRHSAERAYQAGKYCEGCSLKFAWVTASSVAGKDRPEEEIPSNAISCAAEDDDINTGSKCLSSLSAVEPICIPKIASSSPNARQLTCVPLPEDGAKRIEDHGLDVEGTNCTSSGISNSSLVTLDPSSTIPMPENKNDHE